MPVISQAKARLTSLLYLVTIVAGIFAEVGVRARLIVDGDAAGTAAAIAAHLTLYRAGEIADLVMLVCYIAVTALLYALFAAGDRLLAVTAAAFSLIGIAVLAADGALHMAPLALLDGAGLPLAQRDALIGLALDLHGEVYAISLVFFGIYCMLIGWLAIRSGLLPWLIGGLMIVGGACHLLMRSAHIVAPGVHVLPGAFAVAPLVGEAALAVWLILFGLRRSLTR